MVAAPDRMLGDILAASMSSNSPQAPRRQNNFSVSDLLRMTTAEEPRSQEGTSPASDRIATAPAITTAVIDEGNRRSMYNFW